MVRASSAGESFRTRAVTSTTFCTSLGIPATLFSHLSPPGLSVSVSKQMIRNLAGDGLYGFGIGNFYADGEVSAELN